MFGTRVLSSRYLYFPSHKLFLRLKSHFAGLLVGQDINIILQGSNVLTPEGVATVWNISQVRFVKFTNEKNISAIETGQNTGGGRLGVPVQAYHYLSGLSVNHPPVD